MKKKSRIQEVLKYYSNAIPIKKGNNVEIWAGNLFLGKGKNSRCAWEAAYKNNVNI